MNSSVLLEGEPSLSPEDAARSPNERLSSECAIPPTSIKSILKTGKTEVRDSDDDDDDDSSDCDSDSDDHLVPRKDQSSGVDRIAAKENKRLAVLSYVFMSSMLVAVASVSTGTYFALQKSIRNEYQASVSVCP
jgi:hypothetical protein